jgi:DNA-3-methyladenine glycosylase
MADTSYEASLFNELDTDAASAAVRLLGCILECDIDERKVHLRIVETEAYDETDVASHSYKGKTPRSEIMFGPAGYLYVYFTYGMHYCANIVVGETGYGAAVLIRAVEPLDHEDILEVRRGGKRGVEITNGPAKLCQAMGIDKTMNGHDLRKAPLKLIMQPALPGNAVATTARIGISQAKDVPWRFYVLGNIYVSNKSKAQR